MDEETLRRVQAEIGGDGRSSGLKLPEIEFSLWHRCRVAYLAGCTSFPSVLFPRTLLPVLPTSGAKYRSTVG